MRFLDPSHSSTERKEKWQEKERRGKGEGNERDMRREVNNTQHTQTMEYNRDKQKKCNEVLCEEERARGTDKRDKRGRRRVHDYAHA
jgi:hypothetical protein